MCQNLPSRKIYVPISSGSQKPPKMMKATLRDEAIGSESDEEDISKLSKKELAERERLRRKNQKRKEQKKKSKENKKQISTGNFPETGQTTEEDSGVGDDEDVEIEYVAETPELAENDPNYVYFAKIFQAFKIGETGGIELPVGVSKPTLTEKPEEEVVKKETEETAGPTKAAILERILQEEEEEKKEREKEEENAAPKQSKRKLRIATRPSIAELKASCSRPDVVEWHDVTSKDPKLLVHLKSLRNTVPVPRHWCFKRKYLAGKRGFEKTPFELPDFIKRTGIMEMRQALAEKEEEKSMKTKMREKVRPKLGRIDIDYQKLHDAFFRWQTKPKMSILGDLYFEGKELETRLREKKPGELTDDLRIALGMPVGPNATKFPPPWLIAMQRYGPPPSYPNLKIPGLNAAIPGDCSFGYHAGGWGKPPVDEMGKPLYGDVFGVEVAAQPNLTEEEEIERKPWGEMDSEESEEEESDEEEDEGDETRTEADESGIVTPAEGLVTPSGMSSAVSTGVETPDSIELRKKKMQEEGGDTPASLFTVLPEKRVDRVGGQMMASTHVYDLAAAKKDKSGQPTAEGGIEVSLNPEELDQDPAVLKDKYDDAMKRQRAEKDEDFSDMVAEHAARQNRKRKAQEDKKGSASGSSKKYKDFKF